MKLSERMRNPDSHWIGGTQKPGTIRKWADEVAQLEAELWTIKLWGFRPETSALTFGEAIIELQDKLQQAQKRNIELENTLAEYAEFDRFGSPINKAAYKLCPEFAGGEDETN